MDNNQSKIIKALSHANEGITNTLMTAIGYVLTEGAETDKLADGLDLCARLLDRARQSISEAQQEE